MTGDGLLFDDTETFDELFQRCAAICGKAMLVERFFNDVEDRLVEAAKEQRQFLEERLKIAPKMIGSIDPLELLKNWRAPGDRYQSKYGELPRSPDGDRSEEQ